jgi:hypothetical protein
MACATCVRCNRSSNDIACPHCGGAMMSDEDFSTFERKSRQKRPSFFDEEALRKERLTLAIRGIEEKLKRPVTPMERATAAIDTYFGGKNANQ